MKETVRFKESARLHGLHKYVIKKKHVGNLRYNQLAELIKGKIGFL